MWVKDFGPRPAMNGTSSRQWPTNRNQQKLGEVDINTGATVLSNKDWRSYGDIMGYNHQDVGLSSNPRVYWMREIGFKVFIQVSHTLCCAHKPIYIHCLMTWFCHVLSIPKSTGWKPPKVAVAIHPVKSCSLVLLAARKQPMMREVPCQKSRYPEKYTQHRGEAEWYNQSNHRKCQSNTMT